MVAWIPDRKKHKILRTFALNFAISNLERVFHQISKHLEVSGSKGFLKCYKPFETRKDYKEVFLSTSANYEYLDNSFVRQYFKAVCDIIAITMTTLKVPRKKP